MRIRSTTRVSLLSLVSIFVLLTSQVASAPAKPKPKPKVPLLYFTGAESFDQDGKHLIRYRYDVSNKYHYRPELFAAAPNLPPCGTNTNASRTWVDLYDQNGKLLNSFCAFTWPGDLNQLWFALEEDLIPPSWVYIEMNDRQTNTKYKSILAATVL